MVLAENQEQNGLCVTESFDVCLICDCSIVTVFLKLEAAS